MANRSPEREQFLKDIIVGFTEDGGYNGWRQIQAGSYSPSKGQATFIDLEDDCKTYKVTVETVAYGLARIAESTFALNRQLKTMILGASKLNDAGEIDSELADIIVQAGVFEEVIYG